MQNLFKLRIHYWACLLMLNGVFLFAPGFLTDISAQTKLTPELQEVLNWDGEAEVIIYLEDQFDTRQAGKIQGKFAKGAYVKNGLVQTAIVSQEGLRRLFDENQIKYKPFYIINAIKATLDREIIEKISKFPEVKRIYHNSRYKVMEPIESGSSPQLRSIEWGIQNIKADQVWSELGVKGAGAVVGGQDTGYEWTHEALKRQYRGWDSVTETVDHDFNWHDAIDENYPSHTGENPCGYNIEAPCDDHYHGTHTMGTMIGDDGGSNQIGVAPEAQWIGARNMERGYGTFDWYVECFEWFIAPYAYGDDPQDGDPFYAPHVINNSWGCIEEEGCDTSNYELMRLVVENVRNSGIVVVASAGNDGSGCETVNSPAAIYGESFVVGATNNQNNLAGFSSRGPVAVDESYRMKPDVSAPGVNVRSAKLNNTYGSASGTSMAGPHVAGAVALMISAVPSLSGDVSYIEDLLKRTARPRYVAQPCGGVAEEKSPNNEYGYGIIDVYEAIELARSILPLQLLEFSGQAGGKVNRLTWRTTNERDFSHFEMERSTDGLQWIRLTVVSGVGTDSSTEAYAYIDENPQPGKNYYRLRQVDKDGEAVYSETILLMRNSVSEEIVFYPNPVDNILFIKTEGQYNFNGYRLQLFNPLAQMVFDEIITGKSVLLDQTSGLYFYRLMSPDGVPVKQGKIIVN